jgi:predicted PurR-regulated permease PerM
MDTSHTRPLVSAPEAKDIEYPTQPATSPPSGTDSLAPATGLDRAAWLLMAGGVWFVLYFKLVPALVAGLFVYTLIHAVAARVAGGRLSHGRAKILVVALLGAAIVAGVAGLSLLLAAFLKGRLGELPALLDKMAGVLESIRDRLGGGAWIPDADDLRGVVAAGLRDHARELQRVGGEVGRALMHALVGIVIGALISLDTRRPVTPLLLALAERAQRLARAFEQVVFAQVKISALNTLLAGIYLLLVLPLAGVELPLRKTLVGVTFVAGLLPIVGNLISNTVILVVALGTSLPVAAVSLGFLVVVHKLEYFVNARIVGGEIHAAAWEIVLAIFGFEAVFGIPGVVVAPIVYAYLKTELADRQMI